MLKVILGSLALAVAGNIFVSGSPATTTITGDYVEARTASVFAGATIEKAFPPQTGQSNIQSLDAFRTKR